MNAPRGRFLNLNPFANASRTVRSVKDDDGSEFTINQLEKGDMAES